MLMFLTSRAWTLIVKSPVFSYNFIVKKHKFAAIDIGTNTFRLLIAEVVPDPILKACSIKEIHSERAVTRLGEGIHVNGFLTEEAMKRSIAVLSKYCTTIASHDVDKTSAVATSALREAKNSASFLDEVKKITELPIYIISGEEEAKLTASGMLLDMEVPDTALMVDIGGGSTELIYAREGKPDFVYSENTGVVSLAGKYMSHDPPLKEDLVRMESEITLRIECIKHPFMQLLTETTRFIGTAGTITALAAISQSLSEYDHTKIHNYRLQLDRVKDIFSALSRSSSRQRARYLPFELSRLDIIVPGTLILSKLMETFGFQELTVSNYGLREGILFNLYNESREEHET